MVCDSWLSSLNKFRILQRGVSLSRRKEKQKSPWVKNTSPIIASGQVAETHGRSLGKCVHKLHVVVSGCDPSTGETENRVSEL
jgi:hypothetical protein